MILTCANCQARYLVPGHAIGAGGRRVRCTNCGEEWHQEEEGGEASDFASAMAGIEPIPESVRPVPDGSSVPSLRKDRAGAESMRARLAGYAAAAAVILILLSVLIPLRDRIASAWPPAAGFYTMMGMDAPVPGQGLVFDHVHAVSAVSAQGLKVIKIEGRVINLRSVAVRVPAIVASLKLDDGKELDHWNVPHAEPALKPQGELAFSTNYPKPDGPVKNVAVGFALNN